MIKKILTAALLSALLPVSASAATTYITDYQTYQSCTPQSTDGYANCILDNGILATKYATNRKNQLKSQFNTNDVTVTSLNCYGSGQCVIQFRVKY